jgi:small subunit ribosomal protein S5
MNMEENKTTKVEQNEKPAEKTSEAQTGAPARAGGFRGRGGKRGASSGGNSRGGRGGRRQQGGGRGERAKPEFDQKIISIRRVTRVVAGGRRFGFSVALVAGNRNGKVGVGVGKSTDTSLAIEKAFKSAKKNMVEIKRDKHKSIPHEVFGKYCTSEVMIKPAKGKGIVAGSSVRNVLDLAGVTDVSAKILSRSKNKINIAQSAILALSEFTD